MSGIDSSAPASPDSALLVNFSVHSLPSTRDAVALRRTERGRWTMVLILLVCAAPVVASYFAYFVVRPQTRTNYSELISPRPIPATLPLADLGGDAVAPSSLVGHWLVVVVAGGACDGRCERHLWVERQLHAALGAQQDRVDKVWLVDDEGSPRAETLRAIGASMEAKATFAPTTVLRTRREVLATWLAPAPGRALEDHLYLVDPRGDWMMRVPADVDPARLKRDLDRLLGASAGWDQPRR